MKEWLFQSDSDFLWNPENPTEIKGLAKLWETIIDPLRGSLDFPEDDITQAFNMLQEISKAPTGAGLPVSAHRQTGKAVRLMDVIEGFRATQTAQTETVELHGYEEAVKASVAKAKADGLGLTEAEKKAVAWYDNVEKALQGLVKRIQYDKTGAFVGGEETMFMRRMVGAGGMMAITSPATPVKQNVLMTLLGVLVTENSLKEVFEDYIKAEGNQAKTFSQFVEDIVQLQNYTWFRAVLDKIEEKLSVKEGTGFLLSGAEYRRSEVTTEPETKGKRKGKTLEEKTRRETPLTEELRKLQPTADDVFTAIKPPSLAVSDEDKAVNIKLKLDKDQEITVKTVGMNLSNLRKGILLYLDALATPELGDVDPLTKKPTAQSKWAYSTFQRFYTQTPKAVQEAKTALSEPEGQKLLEDLIKSTIERERRLRYGEKPSKETRETKTAPIGKQSVFGNALRDYYVSHFGAEATKVKSFGLSVVFNALADRLGLGSSILPSVVYDVWMNANINNLLREAEAGVNNTGAPNELRLKALQQKYRQALLPYGFDVALSFDEEAKRANIVVKDFETGKVYQRKRNRISASEMGETDLATFNAINNSPTLSKIREEWKQKRMFFASEQTEDVQKKRSRLTNLTRVFLTRFGEEWHSVYQAGTEPAGAIVLKELENAVNHFMNIKYNQNGDVSLLPTHPFYQKMQSLTRNTKLQSLFDGTKEVSMEDVAKYGKQELSVGTKTKALWDLYKDYMNNLREGGVPMAFTEEVMRNAMYTDPTKPMEPRKLQALLWVCTRGAV